MIDPLTIKPGDKVRIISATPSWGREETMIKYSNHHIGMTYDVRKVYHVDHAHGTVKVYIDGSYYYESQLEYPYVTSDDLVNQWSID